MPAKMHFLSTAIANLLAETDVDVFDKLMACYGLPKSTDEEKARCNAQIQWVLRDTTEVPLQCAPRPA